jgi:hypothetical protein
MTPSANFTCRNFRASLLRTVEPETLYPRAFPPISRNHVNMTGSPRIKRMAQIGGMPYSKLVEENAFTPFIRP